MVRCTKVWAMSSVQLATRSQNPYLELLAMLSARSRLKNYSSDINRAKRWQLDRVPASIYSSYQCQTGNSQPQACSPKEHIQSHRIFWKIAISQKTFLRLRRKKACYKIEINHKWTCLVDTINQNCIAWAHSSTWPTRRAKLVKLIILCSKFNSSCQVIAILIFVIPWWRRWTRT